MHDVTLIVAIVVGIPLTGGIMIPIIALLRGWALKNRELALKEKQFKLDQELKTAETHARLLRMDDPDISAAQLNSITEELRQLKQEVAELRQQINARVV